MREYKKILSHFVKEHLLPLWRFRSTDRLKSITVRIIDNYFFYVIGVFILIQIIYAVFGQIPFQSDSLRYYQQAVECIEKGTIYPGFHNLYDPYINAPIYVNFLIVVLSVFKSQSIIPFVNIFLNTANLFLIFKISCKIYNNLRISKIAGLFYIFYLTNIGIVLLNLTELFYLFFTLLALYNYVGNKSYNFILAGLFVFLAMGVRQFGVLLLVSFLIYYGYLFYKRSSNPIETRKILFVSVSFVFFTFSYGLINKLNSDVFLLTGTTGSINILMGANDFATGTYTNNFLSKGELGYIDNEEFLTYSEKSGIWKDRAANWIIKNPFAWLKLLPKKIFHLFAYDDWSINTLLNTVDWNLPRIGKEIFVNDSWEIKKSDYSTTFWLLLTIVYFIHHLFYYSMFTIILLYFLNVVRKKIKLNKCLEYIIIGYVIMGIIATIAAVGVSRYKYPYFIMLIIIISPFAYQLLVNDIKDNN
jgi:hypothetical protein